MIGLAVVAVSFALGHVLDDPTGLPTAVAGLIIAAIICGAFPWVGRHATNGAGWIVGWMGLFFVPPLVTVADHTDTLGQRWGVTAVALVASTVVGTVVTVVVHRAMTDRLARTTGERSGPGDGGGP